MPIALNLFWSLRSLSELPNRTHLLHREYLVGDSCTSMITESDSCVTQRQPSDVFGDSDPDRKTFLVTTDISCSSVDALAT